MCRRKDKTKVYDVSERPNGTGKDECHNAETPNSIQMKQCLGNQITPKRPNARESKTGKTRGEKKKEERKRNERPLTYHTKPIYLSGACGAGDDVKGWRLGSSAPYSAGV